MLVPQVAILFERGGDHAFEPRGNEWVQVRDWTRSAIENRVVHNCRRAAPEGLDAGHHLVQHRAKREQIGARIDRLAPCLLG